MSSVANVVKGTQDYWELVSTGERIGMRQEGRVSADVKMYLSFDVFHPEILVGMEEEAVSARIVEIKSLKGVLDIHGNSKFGEVGIIADAAVVVKELLTLKVSISAPEPVFCLLMSVPSPELVLVAHIAVNVRREAAQCHPEYHR